MSQIPYCVTIGGSTLTSTKSTHDNSLALLAEIEAQRALMMSVSTGGPRIERVDGEYKERRARIQTIPRSRGLEDPNPFADLWAWYGKWSSGDLPSYQSRREFISNLYGPLMEQLRDGSRSNRVFEEPTGWPKIDRTVTEIRQRLAAAKTEEQFQAVGLLCREALITLGQTVFDPAKHPVLDSARPCSQDAQAVI